MAEYTIPKPYRDFYVTNPYIELKESNERLQRIVKNGYVATNPFSLGGNQVLTFEHEKHGFSITNDYENMSNYVIDLSDSNLFESGSINGNTGESMTNDAVIRTKELYPVVPGLPIKFTYTYQSSFVAGQYYNYRVFIGQYDENQNYIGFENNGWIAIENEFTIKPNAKYIKVLIKRSNSSSATPEEMFADLATVSYSPVVPETPSLTVAENTECVPTTVNEWEKYAESSTFMIKTKNYIPLEGNNSYYIRISATNYTPGITLYEYNQNNTFVRSSSTLHDDDYFTLHQDTKKIKIVIFGDSTIGLTPQSFIDTLNYFVITKEPMYVDSNDTRIITMPPFTSLYIESNVPYHGHVLDLAE